jgi:hypothetical protein
MVGLGVVGEMDRLNRQSVLLGGFIYHPVLNERFQKSNTTFGGDFDRKGIWVKFWI